MSHVAFDCMNCGEQIFVAYEEPYRVCPGCGAVYHDGMDLNLYDAGRFDSAADADQADEQAVANA